MTAQAARAASALPVWSLGGAVGIDRLDHGPQLAAGLGALGDDALQRHRAGFFIERAALSFLVIGVVQR